MTWHVLRVHTRKLSFAYLGLHNYLANEYTLINAQLNFINVKVIVNAKMDVITAKIDIINAPTNSHAVAQNQFLMRLEHPLDLWNLHATSVGVMFSVENMGLEKTTN